MSGKNPWENNNNEQLDPEGKAAKIEQLSFEKKKAKTEEIISILSEKRRNKETLTLGEELFIEITGLESGIQLDEKKIENAIEKLEEIMRKPILNRKSTEISFLELYGYIIDASGVLVSTKGNALDNREKGAGNDEGDDKGDDEGKDGKRDDKNPDKFHGIDVVK